MRRLLLLALVVPLAAGCSWASFLFGGHETSSGTLVLAPVDHVPRWTKVERLPRKAIPGAKLFDTSGCIQCHTYAGSGSRNLGAPDLTAIGRRHLGIRFQIDHLKCPSCVNSGSPMPPFRSLGSKRLREVAIFLEASKGRR
jgi:mono/diheme cytochrome c family protein